MHSMSQNKPSQVIQNKEFIGTNESHHNELLYVRQMDI